MTTRSAWSLGNIRACVDFEGNYNYIFLDYYMHLDFIYDSHQDSFKADSHWLINCVIANQQQTLRSVGGLFGSILHILDDGDYIYMKIDNYQSS